MATVKHHKVVAALPAVLEPDAIYYVRTGAGYDQYVTNSAGMLVAYPANYAKSDDARLTNAREWTAETVSQVEAEAGTATTRRAWTALRVFQAIAAWWAASAAKTKLDGIAAGATANATDAQLRDRATHTGTQAISTVSGLQTALNGKINTTERGVSGGIPTLDEFARIPPSQLPSYVDDVLEFQTLANFPATGEGGKIYIAINQGTAANPTRQYRWTGSTYVEINPSPGTTDALAEGSTNLYFSESRVRNAVLTGLSFASSAAVAATDSVLSAFGKIQARLNLLGTAANVNVQTSPTDTTAGAVATTEGARFAVLANYGAYYSGSTGKNIDTLVGGESGLFSTGNPGTFPPGFGSFVYIETQQTYSASSVVQEAWDYGGSSAALGRRAFRVRSNTSGEWSAWQVYYHSGNFDPTTKQDRSAVVTTASSRTLALSDAWNYLRPGTTGAVTLTVPAHASVAFDVGTEITIRALGNITLAAASGATLNAPSGGTLSMTARMTVTLKKVGTNEWDVIGQTVPA